MSSINVIQQSLSNSPEIAILASILIVVATYFYLFRQKKKADDSEEAFDGYMDIDTNNETDSTTTSSTKSTTVDMNSKSTNSKSNGTELRNVFDVKQEPVNPYLSSSSSTTTSKTSEEKPFHSSYYYAHNKSNRGGGYKDGLSANDYVMNGPRLLARNGVPVTETAAAGQGESKGEEKMESKDNEGQSNGKNGSTTTCSTTGEKPTKSMGMSNSLPISRYLWDDDGNNGGIARIYIESLPGGKSTTAPMVQWADAGIDKSGVVAKIVGEKNDGFILQIRQGGDDDWEGKRYHLHVPRMHGGAKEVKVVVKAKKLIVKITKKNESAWPQLASKKGSDDADFVDEDLFRSL